MAKDTKTNPHGRAGFIDLVGYRVTVFEPDYCEMELDLDPARHANNLGLTHGGVIMTVLDAVGGLAGCFKTPTERIPSATLNFTTNFLAPPSGDVIRFTGRRVGGGKSVFFAECQALTSDGELIATASGAYRLFRPKDDT